MSLPVSVDGTELGEVPAVVSRAGLIAVAGRPLIDLLEPVLVDDKLAQLRDALGPNGSLTPDGAAAAGLPLRLDMAALRIVVEPPREARRARQIELAGRRRNIRSEAAVAPADLSAYVNFRAGNDYVTGVADPGREPAVIDLDGAVNVAGTVVEGLATWREESDTPWTRGDTRLVRDFPDEALRATAGDIRYGLDGFQSARNAGGITLARNFALQPYRTVTPAGDTAFDIDRSSRAEIFVNGQRVQTLQLAPGRYNVRNFPFAAGPNDVTIRITDEVGRTETIRFPFIFDATLLGAGEQEFSYAVGVPAEITDTGRDYDTHDFVFSAFHNVGITDALTAGLNTQIGEEQRQIGSNIRFATPIGTVRADLAASDAEFAPVDYATRLQYRYVDGAGSLDNSSFSASATYRGPSFANLATVAEPINPIAVDLGAVYGQRLVGDLFGSIGYNRLIGRDDSPDTDSFSLSFSQQLTGEISVSLFASHRNQSDGEDDMRFFIGLAYSPMGSPHRVFASHDTGDRSSRVNWSYAQPYTLQGVQTDLTLERRPTDYGVSGSARYIDYRFEGTVLHDDALPRVDDEERVTRTGLRFGTALAFADGHVGVSRPINDSFVLVAPHPRLQGQRIDVNPREDRSDARTDWMGPAVLPGLTSYYAHQVTLDAPDLPIGYELGDQVLTVQPTYRSGTLIQAGTGGTVLLDGVLLDATGKPLGFHLGSFTPLDEPDRAPIKFFTASSGRFRVLGLAPGRYELRLEAFPDRVFRFALPDEAEGPYQIGRITFPTE